MKQLALGHIKHYFKNSNGKAPVLICRGCHWITVVGISDRGKAIVINSRNLEGKYNGRIIIKNIEDLIGDYAEFELVFSSNQVANNSAEEFLMCSDSDLNNILVKNNTIENKIQNF